MLGVSPPATTKEASVAAYDGPQIMGMDPDRRRSVPSLMLEEGGVLEDRADRKSPGCRVTEVAKAADCRGLCSRPQPSALSIS